MPAIWFEQADVQFVLAAIKRQRKNFNYVEAHINQQQAAEFEDITSTTRARALRRA
jgi:hypothetical protein